MTDEQNKPVRSREEQISALWDALSEGKSNPNDGNYFNAAAAHVDEAEARGAAEQRRKDAESEYPSAYRWTYGIGGKWRFAEKMPTATSATRKPKFISPLYTRPANVAALEARVKVLEAENEKFRNAMSAIATHVGGFASPNCSVDFMTRAIPEEVRLSFTALTREGGV